MKERIPLRVRETIRAPIRQNNGRHRQRPLSEFPQEEVEASKLTIPKHMIPEGYDLQWVTDSVYQQPMPQRRAGFERRGWVPVHQDDFDGQFDGKWMKSGKEGEINHEGLVLMARPMEWSIAARKEERIKALGQVRIKEQQIKGGDIPGVSGAFDTQHETALRSNVVRKEYERIDVPKD